MSHFLFESGRTTVIRRVLHRSTGCRTHSSINKWAAERIRRFVDTDLVFHPGIPLDPLRSVRIMNQTKLPFIHSRHEGVRRVNGVDFGPVEPVEVRGPKGLLVNGLPAMDPDSIHSVTEVRAF